MPVLNLYDLSQCASRFTAELFLFSVMCDPALFDVPSPKTAPLSLSVPYVCSHCQKLVLSRPVRPNEMRALR